MQVRVKAAGTVNYGGQILDVNPSVIYDGAFATWLRDVGGSDIEVIEDDEIPPVAAAPHKRATAKKRADGDRHAD